MSNIKHLNSIITESLGAELSDGKWRQCFDSGSQWLERLESKPLASIVIPVYNGFEALSRLLDSLEKAEGYESVILVDDHSYEMQVKELCKDWVSINNNRHLIINPRNLGFVRSVNIGIRAAPANHDIVILNSDTVLSVESIERLRNAACSFPNVATVTPLSNSAGVFSIPEPKKYNELKPGLSVNDYASLLVYITGLPYEIVPAGSGFCLYITRKSIDSIGLFDELLFERGYAEETDFCRRASKNGFLNLVDLSTFVFHESEVSFGLEKLKLKQRNAKILKTIDESFVHDSIRWENATKLKSLWKSFSDALLYVENRLPAEIVSSSLKPVMLSILEKRDNRSIGSQIAERSICCELTDTGVIVDFFGLKRRKIRTDNNNLIDLIAYLKAKWNVKTIDNQSSGIISTGTLV